MGDRKVYSVDVAHLFDSDTYIGRITKDGRYYDASGSYVGSFGKNGVFKVPDGILSETAAFSVDETGRLYAPAKGISDEIFGCDQIGHIDGDRVYDVKGSLVARIEPRRDENLRPSGAAAPSGRERTSASNGATTDPMPGDLSGCLAVICVAAAVLFLVLGANFLPSVLRSSYYSDFTRLCFAVSAGAGWCSIIALAIRRITKKSRFKDIAASLGTYASSSTCLSALVLLIGLGIEDGFPADAGGWMPSILGCLLLGLIMCVIPAAIAALISQLVLRKK